jgi:outer membrane protein insertion porin family
MDALRAIYMTHGFLDPIISYIYDVDSLGRVDIHISIMEGEQTFVRTIRFSGNTVFPGEELEALIRSARDSPFDPLALEDDYLGIIARYDGIGYHDARVSSDVLLEDGAGDITYLVSEGEKVYLSEVTPVGAPKVNIRRIKTVIGLQSGMLLTNERIAGARKRIYELDLFSRVRVREEIQETGRKLVFDLTQKEPISLGLRAGYSVLDGPKTAITVRHNNLFGSIRRAMILGKLSFREHGLEIHYRDPITLGHWLEHGGGCRFEQRRELGYRVGRIGGYVTLIPHPFSIRCEVERIRVYDVEIESLATEGIEWLPSLTLGVSLDTRDDPIRPRRGWMLANRIEFAGFVFDAKSNFIRDEFRYRVFFPLRKSTFGVRVDAGLARPFDPTVRIPIHSRFFLGGATTVRGYDEYRIGPKDRQDYPFGGERYGLVSLELRIPLFWLFSTAVFCDVGSLGQRLDDPEIDPKVGLGLGLRLHTPLGPIRVDYARNLEGSGAFHFAIGEAF